MPSELIVPENSTPSSEPATSPEGTSTAPSPEPAGDADVWGALGEGDVDVAITPASTSAATTPPEPAPPAAAASGGTPPAPKDVEPLTPPTQNAASQQTVPAVQPAPSVQAPPTGPSLDEQIRARLQLLETEYAVPAEDHAALLTEPEKVLPKLAARVHQNIVAEMWSAIHQNLPQMIAATTHSMFREHEAKNAFFTAWPELRPYEAQVKQAGMFYRSMNPQAPADVAIKAIGELVMSALGLSRNAPAANAPAAPQRPPAFVPAGVGGAGTPVARSEENPFTAMAFDPD